MSASEKGHCSVIVNPAGVGGHNTTKSWITVSSGGQTWGSAIINGAGVWGGGGGDQGRGVDGNRGGGSIGPGEGG